MKTLDEIRQHLTDYKPFLLSEYHISKIGIFSVEPDDHEINLLVDYTDPPSLLDLVDLELALSEQLGIDVHIITKNSLKGSRRERILAQTVYL